MEKLFKIPSNNFFINSPPYASTDRPGSAYDYATFGDLVICGFLGYHISQILKNKYNEFLKILFYFFFTF